MTIQEFYKLHIGQKITYEEWGIDLLEIVEIQHLPIYIITVASPDQTEHYFYTEDSKFLHLRKLTRLQRIAESLGS